MKTEKDYKRILIVEVNWLGDVLFSTPLIRAVKKKYKDAYIVCMVPPRCKDILEYNPRIDEIIIYDEKGKHKGLFGKLRLAFLIRRRRFDLAILLHRSFTKALLAYFGGIKERVGYITKKRRAVLTIPIEAPDKPLHKVEYFLKIAESLGCDISDKNYEFFVTEKEEKYIEEELLKSGVMKNDFLVVINPGANWPPKRWDEKRFAVLADLLIREHGVKVVASGADKDTERVGRIRKMMEWSLIPFTGKTNLKELGTLMKRANVVISGDSGPMHIAVAMKSRVIALFGPTSPALTGPYGSGTYEVIQKYTDCEIPCYDLTCKNYRCMNAITVTDVLDAFRRISKDHRS